MEPSKKGFPRKSFPVEKENLKNILFYLKYNSILIFSFSVNQNFWAYNRHGQSEDLQLIFGTHQPFCYVKFKFKLILHIRRQKGKMWKQRTKTKPAMKNNFKIWPTSKKKNPCFVSSKVEEGNTITRIKYIMHIV